MVGWNVAAHCSRMGWNGMGWHRVSRIQRSPSPTEIYAAYAHHLLATPL
jgi:hypothetical protein